MTIQGCDLLIKGAAFASYFILSIKICRQEGLYVQILILEAIKDSNPKCNALLELTSI